MLNQEERDEVTKLVGKAITELCNALTIITKAKERVVNGSVNVTAERHLRDAVRSANACITTKGN